MDWKSFLQNNLSPVLANWNELALELYPAETVRFMKRQKDRFQNPVGHATSTALDDLLRGLADGKQPVEMGEALDRLVRVRAVQDFKPSAALRFVFLLKRALREQAVKEELDDLAQFDATVDALVLAAFDRYEKCREKLFEIRAEEYKRQTASLLMRAERSSTASDPSDEITDVKGSSKGGCGA